MVAGVRLSHPDRILFPEQGVSKLALAEFYRSNKLSAMAMQWSINSGEA